MEGGRIEENREREGGQKRKEGGVMNAFCVKAAIVGSRKGSGPPAGLWGGGGKIGQLLISSRVCRQAHEEGVRCTVGLGEGFCPLEIESKLLKIFITPFLQVLIFKI